MKYLQGSFILPVSTGVSQEEWDRIFNSGAVEILDPVGLLSKEELYEKGRDWFVKNDDGA